MRAWRLTQYIALFYRLHGPALFLVPFLMALVALFDAAALSMFLPLLEGDHTQSNISRFVHQSLAWVGVEYCLTNKLVLLISLFVSRGILEISLDSFVVRLASNLTLNLRIQCLQKLFQSNYGYVIQKKLGYLQNALMVEFQNLAIAFRSFATVFSSLVMACAYGAYVLVLETTMAIATLVIGTPFLFLILWFNRKTRDFSIQQSLAMGKLQGILMQCLTHFKYIKATDSCPLLHEKVRREAVEVSSLQFWLSFLQAISSHAFLPIAIALLCGIMYVQVEIRGIPLMQTGFALLLLKRAIDQIIGLQTNYRKFLGSHGAIHIFQEFDAELRKHDEDMRRDGLVPDFRQPLRFEDVSFAYRKDQPVLHHLTFTIAPCTTIAFVGASGSGKSTLVTLLTGILRPTEGRIFLGSVPYDRLDQRALRRQIGYVTQESVIFNDSVKNNIALWNPSIPEERIRRAAEQADIAETIEAMPEKYDTLLGENGIRISGGQRQRISIARELCKDVSLLIFDEATSALDTETERRIQRNIDEFRGQKTIVLIAHRLSTVQNSDRIYVLREGSIVEEGSWEELIAKKGEFFRMLSMQTEGQSPSPPDRNENL